MVEVVDCDAAGAGNPMQKPANKVSGIRSFVVFICSSRVVFLGL